MAHTPMTITPVAITIRQVTRLKLLKRQMYGRAGLDLLRRRMLLAA